ncbi:hypothetical protein Aduo_004659 [Ancylostoma duodenale]
MTKFFYYFAYGSNLLKERIKVQITGAEYECNGMLRNYKVDFVATSKRWHGGLATIKEKSGSMVSLMHLLKAVGHAPDLS